MLLKYFLYIILLYPLPLVGQSLLVSPNSAGGSALGSNGNASYSVGQFLNVYKAGANGEIAHGIQLPFEIFIISDASDYFAIDHQINIFPNPANDFLILKINSHFFESRKLSYILFDLSGKLLERDVLNSYETPINMSVYPSSVYILKIIDAGLNYSDSYRFNPSMGNMSVATFKIIKN